MSTGACGRRLRPVAAPKSYGEVFGVVLSTWIRGKRTNETKASGSEDRRSEIQDLLTKNESLVADSFPTLAGMKPSKHVGGKIQDRGVIVLV
jgi:hypothetical protein